MRVSREEMAKSHQRIIQGAASLMRRNGLETTSVNDVMSEAGLTHGGFYRHFESKDALIDAALEAAFGEALQTIEETDSEGGVEAYFSHYLSEAHLQHPELGCPVAALAVDVSRAGDGVKRVFTAGLDKVIDRLADAGDGDLSENRQAALVRFATLVGAVVIARASEKETGRAVIAACHRVLVDG